MINEYSDLILLAIVLAMMFSSYFDCAQLYARLSPIARTKTVVLSLANWWQYISRLFNMSFAMILAISFEMKSSFATFDILIVGYLFAAITVFLYIKSSSIEILVCRLFGVALFMPSYEFRNQRFWRKLSKPKLKHVLASFAHAICLQIAILVPFFVADSFPNFRMSAVYFGQIITFISTFYLMVYIDPLINNSIDDQRAIGYSDGLIYGKLLSLLVILFISLIRLFN